MYTQLTTTRKARIIGASAVLLAVAAFGAVAVSPMAPDASDLPVTSIAQNLEMPDLASQISAMEQVDQNFTHEEKVRAGDTLATLLTRLGVNDPAAANFIKTDKIARGVMLLKSGKRVQAQTTENGDLNWMRAT
ncbi:MAG: M23 family peptidase, partial [Massilia sp.]